MSRHVTAPVLAVSLRLRRCATTGSRGGVGPATAKLLIRAFGEKTLDVLYSEPERLLEVSGIGEKRARMIQESYAEQAQQREAMVFLQSYGVTPALAVKIYKRYGENVRQIITRNPYRLVEDVEGIGFKTADRIAATLGIEPDSEYRLNAGVKFALADATATVVGINTAVAGFGLGMAVPVNATTRRIIGALLADGRVRRGYLGLVGVPAPLPTPVAQRTGQRSGLRLVEIIPGSPADRAGLRAGDLVLSAGRRPITDAQGIQRQLFSEAIGTRLPITVLRNGAMVDVITVPTELVAS